MKPGELEKRVREALALPAPEGRPKLEELAAHFGFPGLTWLWGPQLYQRDPVGFRPLLLARFSWQTWTGGWRWTSTPWSPALESWLAAAEKAEDVELSRRLLGWKLLSRAGFSFGKLNAVWNEEIRQRWQASPSPALRLRELDKLDLWSALEEKTARLLYQGEPRGSAAFILRHLPRASKGLWEGLFQQALSQDPDFAWKLYRAQADASRWEKDALEVCSRFRGAELRTELERRTPAQVWGDRLGGVLLKILEARGEEALDYVIPRLQGVWKPLLGRGNYGRLLTLAERRGWTELWLVLVKVCSSEREYNQTVLQVLKQVEGRGERLRGLAGVSREWDGAGMGLAQIRLLEPATARALYDLHPLWLKGPFQANLQVRPWSKGYLPLLEYLIQRGEEELLDFFASRYLTFPAASPEIDALHAHFQKLPPRRAACVLTRIPARSIWNYPELIRKNVLARTLFERKVSAYAEDPQALADLVEGSEIHVMALGYRALAQASPETAVRHLDLLQACLFRPLQRQTREWALKALERAAQFDLETARRVIGRARQAQRMPSRHYPKDFLVGMLGRLLARWPQLQRTGERPVVYRRHV